MKKILFFTVFIFCSFLLNAQKTIKKSSKLGIYEIQYSFALQNGIVNIQDFNSKEGPGYLISILDDELNLIKDLVIEAPNSALHNVSLVDSRLHLLIQENKPNQNKIDYNLITINTDDFSKKSKLLYSLNQLNHNTIERFFSQNSSLAKLGRIDVSDDKKYVSLSIESRINSLKTKSILVLFFNSDYELLYEKKHTHTWNKNNEKFQYKSSFINSQHKKLIVLNRSFGNGFKLESVGQDDYKIKDFDFENKTLKTLAINGKGDNFYCIGFYFADSKKEKGGIFYSKFSNDLELLNEKAIQYSNQLLEQDQSKKQKKKGFSAIDSKVGASFVVTDLFINNESDIYLLGEIRISLNNSFAFDDVAVVNLTLDGNLKWSRLVDKSQHLARNSQSSFKPFFIENNLILLFNSTLDLDEMSFDKKSSKPYALEKLNLFSVNFNNEGQFEYKQLTDKKADVNYYVTESKLIDSKAVILFGSRKKDSMIMKLDYEN
jgi:hypothetical protein